MNQKWAQKGGRTQGSAKMALKRAQDPPRGRKTPLKSIPRSPKTAPRSPQDRPKSLEASPRPPQDRPRLPKTALGRPEDPPGRRSDDPQTSPGAPGPSKSRGASLLGGMLDHFGRFSAQFCKVFREMFGRLLGMMGAWLDCRNAISGALPLLPLPPAPFPPSLFPPSLPLLPARPLLPSRPLETLL